MKLTKTGIHWCVICGIRRVSGNAQTCGPDCRSKLSTENRRDNQVEKERINRIRHYGRNNPWVQWEREQLNRQAR